MSGFGGIGEGLLALFNPPSVTTWVRLEPRCRDAEMNTSLQARIYDPLWLLARQWQLGEFEGEDNGSPVMARWRGEAARLNRYLPDVPGGEVEPYDWRKLPLETLAERERARPQTDESQELEKLTFAVRSGQHLLRLLDHLFEQRAVSKSYAEFFVSGFPFASLTPQQRERLDSDSLNYFDLVASRVPDGRKVYIALKPEQDSAVGLPAELDLIPADVSEVETAVGEWIRWCDEMFSEPTGDLTSWLDERMEYALSIAGRFSDAEKVLTATEYYEGHLDWHSFDLNEGKSLDGPSQVVKIVRTTIPAPVSFKGMPAPRFWEFEDAQVDFGSADAGPTDLARMLLIEFALAYGNDWFVIPVEMDVGSLCRTSSLVITDTFGERTLIKPSGEAGTLHPTWRVFQLSSVRERGMKPKSPSPNLFLLPPSLLKTLESKPIEEVLFLRDEMANMAWAVERLIESPSERPLNRYDAYIEQQRRRELETPASSPKSGVLRYRLESEVPDYWIPLLPTLVGKALRLRRGAVLKPDDKSELVRSRGVVLKSGAGLSLCEEEVPREGVRVTRSFQFTRWIDGSSHLWIGRRKQVGTGEGSSGLRFDSFET